MRITTTLLLIVGCGFLLCACDLETPTESLQRSLQEEAQSKKPLATGVSTSAKVNIGDIEASYRLAMAPVAEPPLPANVTEERLIGQRGDLDMVTVHVAPPAPPSLNLSVEVGLKSAAPDAVVVLRAKVLRENQPVSEFAVLLTKEQTSYEHVFDALQGLDAAAVKSVLIAEAELLLLPEGTDPATVDPRAAVTSSERMGALVSNPVVIRLGEGPAAP